MVEQCLFVDFCLHACVHQDKDRLDRQVAGRVRTVPNVTVPRHISALLTVEECLVIPACPKEAVDDKETAAEGVDQRIYLHSVLVELFGRQPSVPRVAKADHNV